MSIPPSVGSGTITGVTLRTSDGSPVAGVQFIFTPALQPGLVTVAGSVPPVVIAVDPVVGVTNAAGVLCGPNGVPGVVLTASSDVDVSPSGWTWVVTTPGTSRWPSTAASFVLAPGEVKDLTTITTLSPSLGVEIAAWTAAIAAVTVLRDEAATVAATVATTTATTVATAALASKANIASPTFTGTVAGVTAAMVGLGNVDNTSDAAKPVSTAGQTALNLKIDTTAVDAKVAGDIANVSSATATQLASTISVRALESDAIGRMQTLPRRFLDSPQTAFSKCSGLTGTPTVAAAGSNYQVGEIITLAGGSYLIQARLRVTAVSAGGVTGVSVFVTGAYTSVPANPVGQAGSTGAGTGATFTAAWSVNGGAGVEVRQSIGPTNAAFRFTGNGPVNLGGSGHFGNGTNNGRHSTFEWRTDSRRLDLILVGLNTRGMLYVDGVQISLTGFSTDASGARFLLAFDFGTAKFRSFRWIAFNQGFGGVNIDGSATITAPTETRTLAWALGDSYNGATGADNAASTHTMVMADYLNIDLIPDGLGSAGWNSTGFNSPSQRITTMLSIMTRLPAYVFFDLGFNDAGGNMTTAAAAFDAAVAAVTAVAPAATIICFGPATPVGPTANLDLVRAMLVGRCAFHNIAFIDVRGFVNDANRAIFTGSDNVHPTGEGHRYLGARRGPLLRPLIV